MPHPETGDDHGHRQENGAHRGGGGPGAVALSSFAVAAMIRSARASEASRLAVIAAEASLPDSPSDPFPGCASRSAGSAPLTWLTSLWFAVTCASDPQSPRP